MTLKGTLIKAIPTAFKNTQFLRKEMLDRYIKDYCPTIKNFTIDHREDLVSYITINYDDCVVIGRILWRHSSDGVSYVLSDAELIEQ